ncbi:MAG: 4a-hydroxytetrahydrobiopterin dehydratase [Egibacteraceae bacterium]
MTVPRPLPAEEVDERLRALAGWSGDTAGISKTFAVDYYTGIRIVVDVAKAAKEMRHHPDIDVRWGTLRFAITTHDAGDKVTELDFRLAERIDEIAGHHGASGGSR